MSVTAIIPLKDHSERLPGKNLGLFCGKPLFYWVISELMKVPEITSIVVNTNDDESAEAVYIEFGYEVRILMRPEFLRGGDITANYLIDWTLREVGEDHFLYTHATNPLVSSHTFRRAIKEYMMAKWGRSLIGVTEHQVRLYDSKFRPINHNPHRICKSQDLEPVYVDNSCIYLFSRQIFKRHGRVSNNPVMFPMSRVESIDIDTYDDWELAESVMMRKIATNGWHTTVRGELRGEDK